MPRFLKRPRNVKASLIGKGKGLRTNAKRSGAKLSEGVRASATLAREKASQTIPWDAAGTVAGRRYWNKAIESSTALSGRTKQILVDRLPTYESAVAQASGAREQALMIMQSILATHYSRDLNTWLGKLAAGPTTIYDRAMDAKYIDTHIGGSLHRLFDGGHTVTGAWRAARDASPDDNIIQEAWGTVLGLFRDGVTPMGLPIFNWDQETYHSVADMLNSTFHIPKLWFADLVTYDAAELLGGAIGVVAVAYNWNRGDVQAFSRVVGRTGVASVASANPALLLVTVVALAKAFHEARKTGDYAEFVDGLVKGGIGTGVVLVTTSAVGGPVVVPLLAGVCAGVLADKAMNRVDTKSIIEFMGRSMNDILIKAEGGTGITPTPSESTNTALQTSED